MMFVHFAIILVAYTPFVVSLDNGLAVLPPMGWMTGERFECNTDCKTYPNDCINESLIKTTAAVMVDHGFKSLGYQYLLIGDCWMNKTRDSNGKLTPDPKRFPSGMKSLADYVHGKGLKLGLYLDSGNLTCHGYPGSLDHMETDAQTLASWGVDMVRMDGCNTKNPDDYNSLYREMGQKLNATGRHILYYCDWPYFLRSTGRTPDYSLIAKTCNVFQPFQRMEDSWTSLENTIKWFGDNAKSIGNHTGPGAWNVPGQILAGNFGLSPNQQKMQMAVWSIMNAPLFVSADLRNLRTTDSLQILQNKKAIAINQDPLGIMGYQRAVVGQVHVWIKPIMPKGSYALVLHYNNISGGPTKVSMKLQDFQFEGAAAYNFTEVFSGRFYGSYKPWYTLNCEVEPTGVLFFECIAIQ